MHFMSATATPPLPAPGFVKARVLAGIYNTTVPTIYKWAADGKIPCIKFEGTIRFDLEKVRAKIEGTEASK